MARVVQDEPRVEKRVVCQQCGRTIAYVENEVQERRGRDISGGPDGCRYIVCPGEECGRIIILQSW